MCKCTVNYEPLLDQMLSFHRMDHITRFIIWEREYSTGRRPGEKETESDRKLLSCQHITTDTGNVHCSVSVHVHGMLTSHDAAGNKKIVFPHTICSKLECAAFHYKIIMLAFGLENCLFWFVLLAPLLQSNILQTVFYCSFWWCYKAQGLKTFGLILEPDHQQYKCGLL